MLPQVFSPRGFATSFSVIKPTTPAGVPPQLLVRMCSLHKVAVEFRLLDFSISHIASLLNISNTVTYTEIKCAIFKHMCKSETSLSLQKLQQGHLIVGLHRSKVGGVIIMRVYAVFCKKR